MLNPLTAYEVVGIVITAVTAIITFVKSQEDSRDQNAAVASVIGLIVTIAFAVRFDTFPKLQSALHAADVIRFDPRKKELLERVANAGEATRPENRLMDLSLQTRLRSLKEQFDLMANGRFIVDEAEMPVFNFEMIRSARRSIRTTNYIGLSRWWEGPSGEQYEAINEQAVHRGVKVSRTFIFEKQDDIKIAEGIMSRELKNGIKVRYALLTELPPLTGDIISIDTLVVGEHRITPGYGLSQALFSLNREDIDRISRTLESVETNARDWKP